MAALRFRSPDFELLRQLSESEWNQALDFSERQQLMLPLGVACRDALPDWVRARVDAAMANNAARWPRIVAVYAELANAFHAAGLEFAVLKGFSHTPLFNSDQRHRYQADVDLLLPESQLIAARDMALQLGYEPIVPFDRHPLNHLPTLIRKTGYQWSGIHYDPETPLSLEIHFQLWNRETEGFAVEGVEQFWDRRQKAEVDGLRFVALQPADMAGNAALHLLRHLLRGSVRPFHVYEIAWFLEHNTVDFGLHSESMRRVEAICFALANRWFDCRVELADSLPADASRWLDLYAASPLEGKFRSNKDEMWLHWTLLDSAKSRIDMVRRRLMPAQLPGPVTGVFVPEAQLTLAGRFKRRAAWLRFAIKRSWHHLRAIAPTASSALRWFALSPGLGREYWQLFFSEAFFDFGMFVFFFLYNLYLLKLGFREDTIGLITGAMTAGSIAGSLLAAIAMQRFGIRPTLMASFGLTAVLSALRAYVTYEPALLALAGIAGVVSTVWPVAFSPAITQLTNEKNRPIGFSLMSAAGISISIFGGLAASRMPGWLTRLHFASSSVTSYRQALFIGCAIVLFALWPVSRVRFAAVAPSERRLRMPSPFLWRFLIAMAAWYLGTGALNPFFNVFFTSEVHLPVEKIGYVFSASQVAQVLAILAAPLVFRKFGLTRSIAGMQFCTGLALVALAAAGGPWWAAGGYVGYMASQYMSEPGMFTMLMEGVPAAERSSASSLNFLVTFTGQAIAAACAGRLLHQFGYAPVMIGAAIMCAFAALLFRTLLAPLDR